MHQYPSYQKLSHSVKIWVLIALVLGSSLAGYAQKGYDFDSARFNKLKPVISTDNRYSLYQGNPVAFWGLKLGLSWQKHEFGIGNAWLVNNLNVNEYSEGNYYQGKLIFRYLDLYYEYRYIKGKRWEIDLPMLAVGAGRAGITFSDKKLPRPTDLATAHRLVFFEPSAAVYYKFMPYTRLIA